MNRWVSLIAMVAFCGAARADEAKAPPAIPELVPAVKRPEVFKLRWIEPGLLAHWLDPQRYPLPPGREAPCLPPNRSRLDFKPPLKASLFALPEGLEWWQPDEEQKAIAALGTPQALQELRRLIEYLDVPLRRVELEATLYKIERAAIDGRVLKDFRTVSNLGPFETITAESVMVYGYPGLRERLDELVRAGQAARFEQPRHAIINNFTACLEWSESRDVEVKIPEAMAPFRVKLTTRCTLNVTPTINGDQTITLLWMPNFQVIASESPGMAQPTAPVASKQTQTVAILRDGDSVLTETGRPLAADKHRYFWLLSLRTVRMLENPLSEKPPASVEK